MFTPQPHPLCPRRPPPTHTHQAWHSSEGPRTTQPHWDPEVASCLSFPSYAVCPHLAPPKSNLCPESSGIPYTHFSGLEGLHAHKRSGALARPAVPFCLPALPAKAQSAPNCLRSGPLAGAGFSSCDNSES